jgi:hypothetical protein
LGEKWTFNSNWMSGFDPCDSVSGWYGVTCNLVARISYVRGLFLNQNNLQGTLPLTLNNLSHVQSLVFDHNNIHGTLPLLDSLSSLMRLHLSSNNFNGTIPPNLTKSSTDLMSLLIADNQLSGSLSSTIYSFQNLNALDVSHNNFTSYLDPSVCDVSLFNMEGNNWFCPLPYCCGQSSLQNCGPTCLSDFQKSSLPTTNQKNFFL